MISQIWFHKHSSLVLFWRLPQHVNQAGLKDRVLLFYLRFCWERRLSHRACKYSSWRMRLTVWSYQTPDHLLPALHSPPTLPGSQKFRHLAGSSLCGTWRARKSVASRPPSALSPFPQSHSSPDTDNCSVFEVVFSGCSLLGDFWDSSGLFSRGHPVNTDEAWSI